MDGLLLRHGGRLQYLRRRGGPEADGLEVVDVTAAAVEYLFEPVTLEQGVRLLDPFLLLRREPLFLRIHRRGCLAECLAGIFAPAAAGPETAPP